MSDEQQQLLERIYQEQQLTESNITLLQQRLELIQAYLTNFRAGLMVLKEIEDKPEGEEMLMNVGGSIFVQAKLVNPSSVTRSIGSGVRIEQSVEDAKTAVQEQISGLEKQYEMIAEEYQKLVARAQVLNSQFQKLAAQVQGQGLAPQSQEE
ncbi:MAG: prefoldin subunit alpha [Candidatus Thorarchaeota archaeon]|nr:MAG: prefoldin subunit alpha [Candidatus Thorarchaeota archaeon]